MIGYHDEVELRYYVQVIHDKAASLHALINDIFVYTNMQNQHINLQKESVHIEEMLNQLSCSIKNAVRRGRNGVSGIFLCEESNCRRRWANAGKSYSRIYSKMRYAMVVTANICDLG